MRRNLEGAYRPGDRERHVTIQRVLFALILVVAGATAAIAGSIEDADSVYHRGKG